MKSWSSPCKYWIFPKRLSLVQLKRLSSSSSSVSYMFCPPSPLPKFLCLILTFNMLLFGWIVFWRWLIHEGGDLMKRISALIKETPERLLFSSTMWEHNKKTFIYEPGRTLNPVVPWSWTSLPLELWRINLCCL